jgi:hypothetical protein
VFPEVRRITSYARSESVVRLGDDTLKELAEAGLNRVHIGMETASDTVLHLVRKGASKETHVEAGLMVKQAGIELSEYVLTGIGGSEFSQEHAVETADALNRINPDFIRFRTLHIQDKISLYPDSDSSYRWATDLELAGELLTLIEGLDGITSCVKSDHSYNLFEDIDGVLPEDKERMAAVPRCFIGLEPERRMLFQVGKRLGYLLRLSDLDSPKRAEQVARVCAESGITPQNADRRIHDLIQERMRNGMPF